MASTRDIVHVPSGKVLVPQAAWCDTIWLKFKGFMMKPTLTPQEALVLVEKRDNRIQTAIHMLFMRFDLGVVWVNGDGIVVDKVEAKRWRLSYTPQKPARFVIEMHPTLLPEVNIGDRIVFNS